MGVGVKAFSSAWVQWLGVTLLLIGLGYAYLYPGSAALFEGRTDVVMSDDTDASGMPHVYDKVRQIWLEHPSWLLYGSLYLTDLDPSGGLSYWMPWCERILALLLSPFFVLEQLTTAVSFALMLLSGLSMFALARYLRWPYALAVGLAIAWAFCPFNLARAKVHVAMTALFHLPLIFLALFKLARERTWRSVAIAAVLLLLATTTVHYFLITTLFLSPGFLVFFGLQPEVRAAGRKAWGRLALAVAPALAFLALSFAFPLPPAADHEHAYPRTGETRDGSLHPFLTIFAARPIDYLGGDIALRNVPTDSNPLRELVNGSILGNLEGGNSHERTNGIRWSILALAVLALFTARRSPQRREIWFFGAFGIFAFWLASSPDFPIGGLGPSGWLYHLVSQIRVPSRAGLNVHFACLMLAGFWIAARQPRAWILAAFPVLMVLDYPPLVQAMPMSQMRPAYEELKREHGACGVGMYFPFVDSWHLEVLYYHFIQRTRGSDCGLLNGMQSPAHTMPLVERFPPSMDYLATLDVNASKRGPAGLDNRYLATAQLRRLAECVPLSFIAFDEHVPQAWRNETCASLGWKMNADLTCVSPRKGQPLAKLPHTCL